MEFTTMVYLTDNLRIFQFDFTMTPFIIHPFFRPLLGPPVRPCERERHSQNVDLSDEI